MARRLEEPPRLSAVARNIHLYDDDGNYLGGGYQNGNTTHINFYEMCTHFLRFLPGNAAWALFPLNPDGSAAANPVLRDSQVIQPGNHVVLTPAGSKVSVSISEERYPRRVVTPCSTSKLTNRRLHFRSAIRERDQQCMISGHQVPPEAFEFGDYGPFEACHIFPHAKEPEWTNRGYQNIIDDPAPASQIGSTGIHSPQNGFLLASHIHKLFDNFKVSINVDDGYKIVCFTADTFSLNGRVLGTSCRDPENPLHVKDELLRWHYHTAILAHMRGAVEPPWESDFVDGDMIGEIMAGPQAAERMEAELFTRISEDT